MTAISLLLGLERGVRVGVATGLPLIVSTAVISERSEPEVGLVQSEFRT
jgi:hypothetical protein